MPATDTFRDGQCRNDSGSYVSTALESRTANEQAPPERVQHPRPTTARTTAPAYGSVGFPAACRRGVESSTTLGRHRWKVERSLSWLSCYRRLQVRWERDSARFLAFVLLACALVCFNRARAGHNQRHAVG